MSNEAPNIQKNQEKKFKLVEFNEQEAKAFTADIDAVVKKHSAHFSAVPRLVTMNAAMPFMIDAEFQAMKKVEVPSTDPSIPSPFPIYGDDFGKETGGSTKAA